MVLDENGFEKEFNDRTRIPVMLVVFRYWTEGTVPLLPS